MHVSNMAKILIAFVLIFLVQFGRCWIVLARCITTHGGQQKI